MLRAWAALRLPGEAVQGDRSPVRGDRSPRLLQISCLPERATPCVVPGHFRRAGCSPAQAFVSFIAPGICGRHRTDFCLGGPCHPLPLAGLPDVLLPRRASRAPPSGACVALVGAASSVGSHRAWLAVFDSAFRLPACRTAWRVCPCPPPPHRNLLGEGRLFLLHLIAAPALGGCRRHEGPDASCFQCGSVNEA